VSRFHEELYRKKGPSHDDLVIRCVSRTGINKILLDLGMSDKHPDFQWDYETEVVCVNRGYKTEFIIGYADILTNRARAWDNPNKQPLLVSTGIGRYRSKTEVR